MNLEAADLRFQYDVIKGQSESAGLAEFAQ